MRRVRGAGLRNAIHFLREEAERVRAAGEDRLASQAALCRRGGFSATTLSRAMSALAEEGIITVVPGGGVFVPAQGRPLPPSASLSAREAGWERVKRAISDDLIHSTHPPGSQLPGYKDLCRLYRTSYGTVRRALESLADDGRVERQGRGFVVTDLLPHRGRSTVVLVTRLPRPGLLARYNARSPDFWRALERQCQRTGMQLEIIGEDDALRARSGSLPSASSGLVLGYIVLTFAYREGEEGPLIRVVRHLAGHGHPVSVLDEDGMLDMESVAAAFAGTRHIRCFTLGISATAGRIVGNYLLGLGHREVALFSVVESSRWCRNRAEGIRQAYAGAGLEHAVTRYTLSAFGEVEDSMRALRKWAPYRRLAEGFEEFNAALRSSAAREIETFVKLQSQYHAWLHYMGEQLTPLFTEVLGRRRATAWVAVSDNIAFVTMGFLRAAGIHVPGDISVVGFDNISESFAVGLTSYDFNVPAAVNAMLGHIVGPSRAYRAMRGEGLEIAGRVVARATTGPAPTP